MFSEGFRYTPRKLIELTEDNPKALWLYCYLVDKMDDRVEMTCKFNASIASESLGIPKTTLIRLIRFLVDIGAVSITSGRKGYVINALNYPNHKRNDSWSESGPKKEEKLVRKLVRKIEVEDTDNKDIFDDIPDMLGPKVGPNIFSQFSESWSDNGCSCIEERKKEKNTIADDMLTPVFLAPQQAESPLPKKRKQAKPKEPPKSGLIFQTYSEELLAAYACKALRWDAGDNSAACRLIDEVGEQVAIEMLRQFFRCKEKALVDNKHPIKFFFGRKQKYHAQISEPIKKQELTDFRRSSL